MIKNKIIYLLIVIIIGFYAILYNDYSMWIISLTIIFLPILLFIVLFYTKSMIKVEFYSHVHVARKTEPIPILAKIKNPTIFPISNISLTIECSNKYSKKEYKKKLGLSIDGKTTLDISYEITSDHVGSLDVSLSEVRTYDYLNVFSFKNKVNKGFVVSVLPDLYDLSEDFLRDRSMLSVESDYFSQFLSGDDPSEVFDIREYRPGDRPQRIHWKLSIKEDKLMVKNFSEPVDCSIVVFLDMNIVNNEGRLGLIDTLLESALSLSYSLLIQNQTHYFSWYDNETDLCKRVCVAKEEDLYEAVGGLFQTMPYEESMDPIASYMAQYYNEQYTDFFYVTGLLNSKSLSSMALAKVDNRQLVYISEESEEELEEMLEGVGIGLSLIDLSKVKGATAQL